MIDKLNNDEVQAILNCSVNTLVMLKRKLGLAYKSVGSDDLEQLREAHEEWINTKSERRKDNSHFKHYKQCMKIIEKDGFIEGKVLLKMFTISNMTNVQAFFENQGEPIYPEHSYEIRYNEKTKRKQRTKVARYYLFSELKEQYRKENNSIGAGMPHKNGHVITNESRRLA